MRIVVKERTARRLVVELWGGVVFPMSMAAIFIVSAVSVFRWRPAPHEPWWLAIMGWGMGAVAMAFGVFLLRGVGRLTLEFDRDAGTVRIRRWFLLQRPSSEELPLDRVIGAGIGQKEGRTRGGMRVYRRWVYLNLNGVPDLQLDPPSTYDDRPVTRARDLIVGWLTP